MFIHVTIPRLPIHGSFFWACGMGSVDTCWRYLGLVILRRVHLLWRSKRTGFSNYDDIPCFWSTRFKENIAFHKVAPLVLKLKTNPINNSLYSYNHHKPNLPLYHLVVLSLSTMNHTKIFTWYSHCISSCLYNLYTLNLYTKWALQS